MCGSGQIRWGLVWFQVIRLQNNFRVLGRLGCGRIIFPVVQLWIDMGYWLDRVSGGPARDWHWFGLYRVRVGSGWRMFDFSYGFCHRSIGSVSTWMLGSIGFDQHGFRLFNLNRVWFSSCSPSDWSRSNRVRFPVVVFTKWLILNFCSYLGLNDFGWRINARSSSRPYLFIDQQYLNQKIEKVFFFLILGQHMLMMYVHRTTYNYSI